MSKITATFKKGDVDKQASIDYDFGSTLEEAVELVGAEVVLSNYKRAATITAQAAMRRYLQADIDEAQIQEKMNSWKPGVALERASDPTAAVLSKFEKLSPEKRAALLEQLMAAAG